MVSHRCQRDRFQVGMYHFSSTLWVLEICPVLTSSRMFWIFIFTCSRCLSKSRIHMPQHGHPQSGQRHFFTLSYVFKIYPVYRNLLEDLNVLISFVILCVAILYSRHSAITSCQIRITSFLHFVFSKAVQYARLPGYCERASSLGCTVCALLDCT